MTYKLLILNIGILFYVNSIICQNKIDDKFFTVLQTEDYEGQDTGFKLTFAITNEYNDRQIFLQYINCDSEVTYGNNLVGIATFTQEKDKACYFCPKPIRADNKDIYTIDVPIVHRTSRSPVKKAYQFYIALDFHHEEDIKKFFHKSTYDVSEPGNPPD